MPVQSALTVYVPGMDWLRATSPLKLAETTAFTFPLPSYFSIPAMANGAWSFPVTSTPSWANRYVPCSRSLRALRPGVVLLIGKPSADGQDCHDAYDSQHHQ